MYGNKRLTQEDIIKDIENDSKNKSKYFDIVRYGHYYVPIDDSTFIFSILLMFFVSLGLCIVGLYIIFSYKPIIIDPLENIKKLVLYIHLVLMIIFIIVYVIFYTKVVKKNNFTLVKVLTVLTIVSSITLLVIFGIRLKLDASYYKCAFQQIETGNLFKPDTEEIIANAEEYYHIEYDMFYDIFKLKSSIMLGIHLLYNTVLIANVSKLIKIKRKQDKIRTSDEVLFDEEENIKF